MENFTFWIIFVLAGILVVVLLLPNRFNKKKRTAPGREKELHEKKVVLYEELTALLLRYTDLAGQLADEYRFAFKHADKLTVESEEAAEALITELEKIETSIKEKTSLLTLVSGPYIADQVNDFLLKDRNKRHASPRDLEKFTENARHRSIEIIGLMQQDLGKTQNQA